MQKSVSKYLAIASVLATISVANAEKSGAFVGLEAGVSIFNLASQTSDLKDSKFGIGGSYGVIAGYKQFFTPYLGLRYYANLNYAHGSATTPTIDAGGNNIFTATSSVNAYHQNYLLNYGVNVDFLANFVSKEIESFGSFDFGGFVGVGLGGNTYLSDLTLVSQSFDGSDSKSLSPQETTKFNVALNVGLRANMAENHGVELVARVPFIKAKMIDDTNFDGVPLTITRTYYTVSLRYTYSFQQNAI